MNLKERLALIKSNEKNNKGNSAPRPRKMPDNWRNILPYVWIREIQGPIFIVPPFFYSGIIRSARPSDRFSERTSETEGDIDFQGSAFRIPADRVIFFDLETTGLSGDAGTYAFLSTTARFEGRNLVLNQVFLEDYPGERDFLSMVISQLSAGDWIASYNGATFDIPLLRSRCILNGIVMPTRMHVDVLHDCRRFWGKILDSCSLASMEKFVLKSTREFDIPGSEIPRVWLDYVKSDFLSENQKALMELVWQHNILDVVSLARLFLHIESLYSDPYRAVIEDSVDPLSLANRICKLGRLEEAKSLLLMIYRNNKEHDLSREIIREVQRYLAKLARKDKDLDLFSELVLSMDSEFLYGCVAKAKLFEHTFKDEKTALVWAQKAHDLACNSVNSGTIKRKDKEIAAQLSVIASLDHRIARLERKIANRKSIP